MMVTITASGFKAANEAEVFHTVVPTKAGGALRQRSWSAGDLLAAKVTRPRPSSLLKAGHVHVPLHVRQSDSGFVSGSYLDADA